MAGLTRFSLVIVLAVLAGCASKPSVVSEPVPLTVPLRQAMQAPSVAFNVSIMTFDQGAAESLNPIRKAESQYLPYLLRETLLNSGYWGAVRVVPQPDPTAELMVSGKILVSNGIALKLHITVRDSSGRLWLDKDYQDWATDHGYSFAEDSVIEPFQDLYNQIANDIYVVRSTLNNDEQANILDTAMLKYAISLSPEAFSEYLTTNEDGIVRRSGLPARNDPMYQRVREIREAEYDFIDAIDEQYQNFYKKMQLAYSYWRRYNYELTQYNDKIEQQGDTHKKQRTGSYYAMEDVYETYKESKMNEDSLREMADSFDAELTPTVTKLEGKVVNMTGTLENQYRDWRRLLKRLYADERGVSN